jgi:hypothetical protein
MHNKRIFFYIKPYGLIQKDPRAFLTFRFTLSSFSLQKWSFELFFCRQIGALSTRLKRKSGTTSMWLIKIGSNHDCRFAFISVEELT